MSKTTAIRFITNVGRQHPGEIAVLSQSQADAIIANGNAVPADEGNGDEIPWWTPRPDPITP